MKHYDPVSVYTHCIWKEDLHSDTLTNRQETINTISKSLPKFFSRAHESNCKSLVTLLMHNKISPAQYCTLYSELIGDCSVTDNANSKAVDKRIELELKTADKSILQDLRVNSGQKNLLMVFGILLRQKLKHSLLQQ